MKRLILIGGIFMNEKLPCAECKGKCCTYPALKKKEYKVLRDKYGIPKGTKIINIGDAKILHLENGNCPYLKDDGSCGVYLDRPRVCRLYGNVPEMPCMYLYPDKAKIAVDKMLGTK